MSHIPAIVAQIARTAQEAAETHGALPGTQMISIDPRSGPHRIPLAQRPSRELWAKASELTEMAEAARTMHARTSLETLAARFAALAAQRELAEGPEEVTHDPPTVRRQVDR